MWFDTHCHLDSDAYNDDRDAVIQRAHAAGVTRMMLIECIQRSDDIGRIFEFVEQHPGSMWASLGVHPHDAAAWNDAIADKLAQALRHAQCRAVGETGLDYHYDHSPRLQQQEAFRRHIDLAKQLRKPLVVHTRSAAQDTLRILREERAQDAGGIIHCFSEDADFAKQALDLGFVASFSGIVTFKNATAIRDAACRQPLDAILVETDAPYLAPVPYRGKRNEPAWTHHTGTFIAEQRGIDPEEFAARTTDNACRLLGIENSVANRIA